MRAAGWRVPSGTRHPYTRAMLGLPDGVTALLFDLDGVLVDSEERWDGARRELVGAGGLTDPAPLTLRRLRVSLWTGPQCAKCRVPVR